MRGGIGRRPRDDLHRAIGADLDIQAVIPRAGRIRHRRGALDEELRAFFLAVVVLHELQPARDKQISLDLTNLLAKFVQVSEFVFDLGFLRHLFFQCLLDEKAVRLRDVEFAARVINAAVQLGIVYGGKRLAPDV